MIKTVLLTRPRKASQRWADLLARQGYDSVVEPLLSIEPTRDPRPQGDFQAVLITSASAPDALEEVKENLAGLLSLPCFCVGFATGAAARALGFTDVRCGTADGEAIAKLATSHLTDKTRPLLHIAGDTVDGKARYTLAKEGLTLEPWIVYRAVAVNDFTQAVKERFARGDFAAVPVFSPRTARVLVSLIEKNRLSQASMKTAALGLSQPVIDVLQILPWRRLRMAASPEENAILACLQTELSMTQPDLTPTQPNAALAPPAKKSNKTLWGVIAVLILSLAGAVALTRLPFFQPKPTTDMVMLEKRIDNLENRLSTLTEIQAAAPATSAAPANTEALEETVKNLQDQIAQLGAKNDAGRDAAQKYVAAAFAFWDLRDAASSGRDYTAQLAALQNAAGDDTVVAAQSARLFTFANQSPPTFAQLRASLTEQETAAPVDPAATPASLWERFKNIMRPLIAVHPLHDPNYAALEQALDANNGQAAQQAFDALSDAQKTSLAAWHEKLAARITIDDALHILAAHFTTASSAPSSVEAK